MTSENIIGNTLLHVAAGESVTITLPQVASESEVRKLVVAQQGQWWSVSDATIDLENVPSEIGDVAVIGKHIPFRKVAGGPFSQSIDLWSSNVHRVSYGLEDILREVAEFYPEIQIGRTIKNVPEGLHFYQLHGFHYFVRGKGSQEKGHRGYHQIYVGNNNVLTYVRGPTAMLRLFHNSSGQSKVLNPGQRGARRV